jgi:ABC-type multidrug transport system fused ATPase/permease subunit
MAMSRVLVLEEESITENGTPRELIQGSTGWFRRFYNEQQAEKEFADYAERFEP